MKGFTKLTALVLSAVLLLTGCSNAHSEEESAGEMTVNDTQYTMEEYTAAYRFHLMLQLGVNPGVPLSELLSEEQKAAIHQETTALTQNYLTYLTFCAEKFQEYKLTLDDEAMRAWTDGLAETMGGRESMHEIAAQWGLTLPELYRFMSVDTMILQLQEYILKDDHTVDLEYLQKHYLRCKHILIADEEGDPEKEALAEEVAAKAKNGEDFDQLILQYNEDPGMFQNPRGYLFTEGEMVEEFYQATLALEENETSEPVRSSFGWHVIQRLPITEEDQMQRVQDLYLQTLQKWLTTCAVDVSEEVQDLTFDRLVADLPQQSANEADEVPAA